MQMTFQDPFASLNPRMASTKSWPSRSLSTNRNWPPPSAAKRPANFCAASDSTTLLRRYPHEFSGGQCQRIGIARALILHPKLVVADEPVSALDVSVAAQVLRLLRERQQEFRLTYIFISHSLPVVAQVASRIAVMRAGQFVQSGSAERILREPRSPYTRELLAAVPEIPRPAKV